MLDPAGLLGALKRLRYARSSGRAEALFRVAFAAVLLVELLTLRPYIAFFYSTESPRPPSPSVAAYYTPTIVGACYLLWLASAGLLLVGLLTRVAAVGCYLGCMYFLVMRHPGAEHATDWLLPGMAFHLMLMSSNRRLALDRIVFRKLAAGGDVPAWPLRLAQLTLAFFYFTAGTSKLGDNVWRHGQGFYMTFANPVLSHANLTWLARMPFVSPTINDLVMLWECAMPLLLLWRRTRLFAVVSAVAFLLSIDLDLPVGWFAWFCIANLFIFADDLEWPRRFVARCPWLASPALENSARGGATGSWKERAISAFLVFHLASFAWMQVAYGLFAKGRYDVGMRLVLTPVLGGYGYGIASVRFYELWPSIKFYSLHLIYLEITPRGGAPTVLPPFDDNGRPRSGWLESREVREDIMLMSGLSDDGWRRYFEHTGQRYAKESGRCPEQIQAYAITVGPETFDTDLRRNKAPLTSARFDCSPTTLQVRVVH